jgi:hypothetical protein
MGENETVIKRTPPATDYVAWFDASDFSSFTIVSSAVSQWNDLSGGGFNLTQATATNRPAYGSRFINGFVVPDFDGVDNRMDSTLSYTGGNNWSFFCVGETDSNSAFHAILASQSGNGRQVAIESTSQLKLMVEAAANATYDNHLIRVGVPFAFGVSYQNLASDEQSFKMGTGRFQTKAGTTMNFTTGNLRVGSRSNGTNWYNGSLAELIFYNRTLSQTEMETNVDYLNAKWGIPTEFSRPS